MCAQLNTRHLQPLGHLIHPRLSTVSPEQVYEPLCCLSLPGEAGGWCCSEDCSAGSRKLPLHPRAGGGLRALDMALEQPLVGSRSWCSVHMLGGPWHLGVWDVSQLCCVTNLYNIVC